MLSFVALTTIVSALVAQASAAANITAVIPSSTEKCIDGFHSGSDTALITLAYPYEEILHIIDSFAKPNQWAIPPNTTVVTNGTDNTPGTAREYTLDGVTAIETLQSYANPKGGPFHEVYTAAKLTIAAFDLSIYSDYDSVMLSPACGGRASAFNFTIKMCATNITEAIGLQHLQHLKGPQALAAALGGANFTSCDALVTSNATVSASAPGTVTTSIAPATGTLSGSAVTATATTTATGANTTGASSGSGTATGSSASATATNAAVRYGGMTAAIAGLAALVVAAIA